ncbi:hypothetical protein [Roseimaritima ulvae]|uniref:Uncharacterized protein n=1 Tax=Roseimaritima ulvae TaxID=980254 RepID=A0A5B9QZL7_9BACT|nr:hypothetical protein [Roseimaritima ulvae]QEG39431.1 hypothetical protein UC8_14260 [Roseimaritima ulvae]
MNRRQGFYRVIGRCAAAVTLGMLSQLSASGQGYAVSWGQPKAATVGESHARGMADVIRSQAQANYVNAEALGSVQDAQTKYLNNRALATETYLAKRRMWDDYRQKKQDDSHAKLTAYMQQGKMAPISSSELYPDTGAITWPLILTQEKYAKTRQGIEQAFAKRATTGSLSTEEFMKTSLALNEWRRSLASVGAPFSPTDVREAAQLLNRLDKTLKADFQ